MQEQLRQVLARIKELNSNLSKRNRRLLIISVLAIVVVVAGSMVLLNSSNSAPLFVDMGQPEAVEIIGKLSEMGVSANYADGAITVPAAQADTLRAQLILQGYPKSGFSYDAFISNVDITTTDFEKKTYKLYELQDRMAATIRHFDGVADAVVTISLGSEGEYVLEKDKKESSASVSVFMKSGGTPEEEQVRGIQRLVSSAVAGMKPESVVVLDSNGNDLSPEGVGTQSGTAKLKIALEQEAERKLQTKLIYLLEPMFEKDKVRVTVSCVVDIKKKIQEIITYTSPTDDKSGIISHEQTGVEVVGPGTVEGGEPGTETNANIPIYPNISVEGNDIYYTDDKSFDYLVNSMKEQIQDEGGDIIDKTVGVVVDDESLSRTAKEDIKQLVAVTAGISPELVDEKVYVINAKFLEEAAAADAPFDPITFAKDNMWLLIAAAGALLVLLVLLALVLRRARKRRAKRGVVGKKSRGKGKGEVEVQEEGLAADDILNTPLDPNRKTREMELKEQIGDFADANPEISAQLIKTWLKGGGDD